MRDILTPNGENSPHCLDLHVPTLTETAREHLSDRACVIQLLISSTLWALTRSCYFGMSTIGVVAVELISAFRVQQTVERFVTPFIVSYDLWAFRTGEWTRLTTNFLVPGDLVGLGGGSTATIIPCDMVIVKGTLLVKELTMAGESPPKLKMPSPNYTHRGPLTTAKGHDGDLLPGGAKILGAFDGAMDWEGSNFSYIPQPLSNGTVLALVTQTGRESSHVALLQSQVVSLKESAKVRLEIAPLLVTFFLISCAVTWQLSKQT